jgi:putative phosphoesterase
VQIGVISDTHSPGRGPTLPKPCLARLAAADLILHAGDHCDVASLAALRRIGPPVVSVRGNVDHAAVRRALPHETSIAVEGIRIAMIHDAGPARGRIDRLRRLFPARDVVVFGHSHVPVIERADDGFLILNPGSPTDRRRQPSHTMAELRIEQGQLVGAVIIPLDSPVGGPGRND